MLKPDAFERGLDQVITDGLKDIGMKITKSWEGKPAREQMERLHDSKRNRSFFNEWMDYLVRGKIRAMIVEGEDAVSKVLEFKNKIRNKYATNEKRINLMHSSDTVAEAEKESGIFFDIIL